MDDNNVIAMLTFGKAALEVLKHRAAVKEPPMRTRERVVFDDDGSWIPEVVQERDYEHFVKINFFEHLENMTEAAEAARILLENGILPPRKMSDSSGKEITNPSFDQMKPFLIQTLLPVVTDYLERTNSFDFSEQEFKVSYEWFKARWSENPVNMILTVPLIGFESDIDRIELPENLVLDKITAQEKTQLWNAQARDMGLIHTSHLAISKFKLRADYYRERDGPDPSTLREAIHLCITALRLLHSGDIGITAGFIERNPPYLRTLQGGVNAWIFDDLRIRLHSGIPQFIGFENVYRLAKNEVPEFIDLAQILTHPRNAPQVKLLDVGFRWFNRAFSHESPEDKIISFTVALENTLLFNIRDELKYRLALRGATLLRDKIKPEETAACLRKLYDARSAIVHDGKSLVQTQQGVSEKEFLWQAEQITREVLRTYISRMAGREHNLEAINQSLDSTIIESLCSTRDSI